VQRVVSYVEIRNGQPGGVEQPGPSQAVAPPPPGGYLDQPGGPPSNAPIQVQRLQ
jgi:hypothetical protein